MTNYCANMGPQCLQPEICGLKTYDPFCNMPGWGIPRSRSYGDTFGDASQLRGLFSRTGTKVSLSMVPDGLSNTLMIGEGLPKMSVFYRIFPWYNSDGGHLITSTIVPINMVMDDDDYCTHPERSTWTFHGALGFKSNHTGGVNFVFA